MPLPGSQARILRTCVFLTTLISLGSSAALSQQRGDSTQQTKLPDAVLAIITQFVLGITIATSAVPPTVLSVQDRGSETIGVLVVLIITAAVAGPIRDRHGAKDLSSSEYILVVLTPLITRMDLGLLIWVNVNKALIWAEQMLYATREELMCSELLQLASAVWHNGESRISDPEFGQHGGEAAVLMHQLQQAYHPRNAGPNIVLWIGHFTLWPVALLFHFLLQVITIVGLTIFFCMAHIAHLSSFRFGTDMLQMRGSFLEFVLRTNGAQGRKLFMRREAASLFDSHQHLMKSNKRTLRHLWSMIATVDAIVRHPHYSKLFDIMYPMRAPKVLQRALESAGVQDVLTLLNKESIFFTNLPDMPVSGVGEKGSRQLVLYRVMAWPPCTPYAESCLGRLKSFAEDNISFWKATENRLLLLAKEPGASEEPLRSKSEFHSVRDVMRRCLVQLIMLAFSDGLGECYLSGETDVSGDLANAFMEGRYPGIEMAVRLASSNPSWLEEDQTAESSGTNMLASVSASHDPCRCDICEEISRERRLNSSRYLLVPKASELAEQLEEAQCLKARGIAHTWASAVRMWTKFIFEPREAS